MKKFWFNLCKYKYLIIVSIILIAFIGFITWGILALIPDRGVSFYGGRLDGVEEFNVSESRLDEVAETLSEEEYIKDVDVSLAGRIINFRIEVFLGTDLIVAKSISDEILTLFSDEEKSFFDMQIFLTSEEDETDEVEEEYDEEHQEEEEKRIYPQIGYKHRNSLNFVWTN